MTCLFENRERGFETKWAHDEETLFQIMAMRDAWLGRWAAETMQLPPDKVELYVKNLIKAGLTGTGKEPVFEKIRGDFNAKMLACPDTVIRRKMEDLFHRAREAVPKNK